jgi:hypothetical protein
MIGRPGILLATRMLIGRKVPPGRPFIEKALAEKLSRRILSSLKVGAAEIGTAKAKQRAISRLKTKEKARAPP